MLDKSRILADNLKPNILQHKVVHCFWFWHYFWSSKLDKLTGVLLAATSGDATCRVMSACAILMGIEENCRSGKEADNKGVFHQTSY